MGEAAPFSGLGGSAGNGKSVSDAAVGGTIADGSAEAAGVVGAAGTAGAGGSPNSVPPTGIADVIGGLVLLSAATLRTDLSAFAAFFLPLLARKR